MASKSGELRMMLLGVALLGLLLLSQYAAADDEATESAPAGKKKTSFSFNSAGGRTLSSFSMNANPSGGEKGKGPKSTSE